MRISFIAALFTLHILFSYSNSENSLEVSRRLRDFIANSETIRDNKNSAVLELNEIFFKGIVPSYLRELISDIEQGGTLQENLLDGVSEQCRTHTSTWIQALISNFTAVENTWALHMIDAWPKIPEGILSGHTTVLGDFDECVGVRANLNPVEKEEYDFKGKYCTTILAVDPTNLSLAVMETFGNQPRDALELGDFLANQLYAGMETMQMSIPVMGSCYPSTCSTNDVTLLLRNTFQKLIPVIGPAILPMVTCTTDDAPKLVSGDIAMISIISVIVAICVAGTAIDLLVDPHSSSRNGYAIQALLAFSVYTNTKKWLNTKSGGGGGENFGAMHGIRFLSTCWVVLAHTWAVIGFMNTWNNVDALRIFDSNWTIYAVINGTVSVDTFFAMSGLLFAYNMLKVLQKSKGSINIPMMYLHRYLRLTPTYALLVGLVATVYGHLGNGPMWSQAAAMSGGCRKNWWHNLLYINNFIEYSNIGDDSMCHGETWYLANDMQFFLISPLFVYPLFKWETFGMILLALASLASVATPWIIHATLDPRISPTLIPRLPIQDFFKYSYVKPWTRFGPYVVGLWFGFLLYKTANKKVQIPKFAVIGGFLLSTGVALAIIFGIIPWFDPSNEIPEGLGAFYAGTHRFAWGIVICWIIFACTRGYGGPINTFLCWKPFIPLARLSFCVYLISFALQNVFVSRLRQPTTYDAYVSTNMFFAHMVMSLLIGFLCCITMESPFIALEKLLFQGPTQVKKLTKLQSEKKDAGDEKPKV